MRNSCREDGEGVVPMTTSDIVTLFSRSRKVTIFVVKVGWDFFCAGGCFVASQDGGDSSTRRGTF